MKNQHLFATLALVSAILLLSFIAPPTLKMPKKVNDVIQNKCYGCHSSKGKSEKARAALNWEELATLSAEDQLQKMKSIQTVLEKGTMPPAGMVERDPSKKLSDLETETLKKWADKSVKKLSK